MNKWDFLGCRMAKIAAVVTALAATTGPVVAQETIVVASYGGQYQDYQRQGLFEPFTKATGIKVIDVSGVSVVKIRAMVMTGNLEVDVFRVSSSDVPQLASGDLLDPIDYSKIDSALLSQLMDGAELEYFIGANVASQVIAYNTNAFPDKHPNSWADVWNVEEFPGPRILSAATYASQPIEPSLLAAGLPKDKIYPLDLDKAYEMLTQLRPNVIRWVSSGSAAPQALVDGEAVVGQANQARIQELKDNGAPVDYVWNEGISGIGFWAIPKGGKNREAVLKFLEFSIRPEVQAELARIGSISPVNLESFELLSPEEEANLGSRPENLAQQLSLDAQAWGEKSPSGQAYYEENRSRWVEWSRQN